MTPYEREILIRTIMGEAANEGPEGWAAVAHVIKNRTVDPRWPGDPASVALEPQQFSAWNEGQGGNDLVRKYGPEDQIFQRIGAVVDDVWDGDVPDPTGGATHYYAPAGMPGRREPKWFPQVTAERGSEPTVIGNHIFTGKVAGSTLPSDDDPVPYPPRRPHSRTPGLEGPEYDEDSPYYRAPDPFMAPVIPVPQPKPEPPGFNWGGTLANTGGLLQSLGGNQAQAAAQALESQAMLDEAERARRAWDQSFSWL